jgi:hypothetical protein
LCASASWAKALNLASKSGLWRPSSRCVVRRTGTTQPPWKPWLLRERSLHCSAIMMVSVSAYKRSLTLKLSLRPPSLTTPPAHSRWRQMYWQCFFTSLTRRCCWCHPQAASDAGAWLSNALAEGDKKRTQGSRSDCSLSICGIANDDDRWSQCKFPGSGLTRSDPLRRKALRQHSQVAAPRRPGPEWVPG